MSRKKRYEEDLFLVGAETGEIYADIESGSKVGWETPEQQKNRIKHGKTKDKQMLARYNGYHYLFVGHERLDLITPKTLCKLVFLSTYMNYSGALMKTERIPMYKKDLPKVLGISKVQMYEFLDEVYPDIIWINDDNTISMNTDMFYRGRLKKSMYNRYTRAFVEGVRSLYNSVGLRKHKQLGYVFQMLPYMNRTFNVLCHPDDILETDTLKIRTISFNDFCDLIGYDRHNAKRLKAEYKKIVFITPDGVTRDFVRIIDDYGKIYVNPRIFYAGDDYKQVDVLNTLFT